MGRVMHFEISANDPEKMVGFYESVFGWRISKWIVRFNTGTSAQVTRKRRGSIGAYSDRANCLQGQ